MKQHLYTTLIEDFCRLTGLPSAPDIVRGGTVETEGIRFSLVYISRVDPDLLFIYCDFLNPPAESEIDGYRALLTKNLFLYSRDGPVFALSPDTGRVVLAQHLPLDGLSATALADKLILLASTIHALRKEMYDSPMSHRRSDQGRSHPASPARSRTLSLPATVRDNRVLNRRSL